MRTYQSWLTNPTHSCQILSNGMSKRYSEESFILHHKNAAPYKLQIWGPKETLPCSNVYLLWHIILFISCNVRAIYWEGQFEAGACLGVMFA